MKDIGKKLANGRIGVNEEFTSSVQMVFVLLGSGFY